MTIEISLLLSGMSLAFAVYFGLVNAKRNHKTDVKQDTVELTTVIVKLESIGTGIAEIKAEMTSLKTDVKETRERLIAVEASTKQAHKRIDAIEGRT